MVRGKEQEGKKKDRKVPSGNQGKATNCWGGMFSERYCGSGKQVSGKERDKKNK